MLGIEHVISQEKQEMTQRAMRSSADFGTAYDAARSGATAKPVTNNGSYDGEGNFTGFLRCGSKLNSGGLAP